MYYNHNINQFKVPGNNCCNRISPPFTHPFCAELDASGNVIDSNLNHLGADLPVLFDASGNSLPMSYGRPAPRTLLVTISGITNQDCRYSPFNDCNILNNTFTLDYNSGSYIWHGDICTTTASQNYLSMDYRLVYDSGARTLSEAFDIHSIPRTMPLACNPDYDRGNPSVLNPHITNSGTASSRITFSKVLATGIDYIYGKIHPTTVNCLTLNQNYTFSDYSSRDSYCNFLAPFSGWNHIYTEPIYFFCNFSGIGINISSINYENYSHSFLGGIERSFNPFNQPYSQAYLINISGLKSPEIPSSSTLDCYQCNQWNKTDLLFRNNSVGTGPFYTYFDYSLPSFRIGLPNNNWNRVPWFDVAPNDWRHASLYATENDYGNSTIGINSYRNGLYPICCNCSGICLSKVVFNVETDYTTSGTPIANVYARVRFLDRNNRLIAQYKKDLCLNCERLCHNVSCSSFLPSLAVISGGLIGTNYSWSNSSFSNFEKEYDIGGCSWSGVGITLTPQDINKSNTCNTSHNPCSICTEGTDPTSIVVDFPNKWYSLIMTSSSGGVNQCYLSSTTTKVPIGPHILSRTSGCNYYYSGTGYDLNARIYSLFPNEKGYFVNNSNPGQCFTSGVMSLIVHSYDKQFYDRIDSIIFFLSQPFNITSGNGVVWSCCNLSGNLDYCTDGEVFRSTRKFWDPVGSYSYQYGVSGTGPSYFNSNYSDNYPYSACSHISGTKLHSPRCSAFNSGTYETYTQIPFYTI